MAGKSTIEWTNSTWNPVTGCTKVSTGCDRCYAERLSERFRGVKGHPFESGFDLTLRPKRLEQPVHWRRPQLIFVNSMSDLFHKEIPIEYIRRVFDTMERADWHVYQVLTKRSSLMRRFVRDRYRGSEAPSHIWLGVSVEDAAALTRLRHLQQTSASVRFVSFEPLIGPLGEVDLQHINWVIAGGESGPEARPMQPEWARALRDQCQAQGVAFFFKQWGGRTPKAGGNTLDGRQWLEYPEVDARRQPGVSLQAVGAPGDGAEGPPDVGPWAREKLECLRKYLHAYTTILSKQRFEGYFYIDAFAGPGTLRIRRQEEIDAAQELLLGFSAHAEQDSGTEEYIGGSPRVALELEKPFTDYVFIETDDRRRSQLRTLKHDYRRSERRIHVRSQDCNDYLRRLISKVDWSKWRGVVFLDPFGMQVRWDTLVQMGRTEAMEVFLNFPVGMAIQRLLKRSGQFSARERNKLDRYFGTSEWYDLLYERRHDMFGSDNISKIENSGDILVRWYRKRLKDVFGYVSTAREIQSTRGRALYCLIFAGPNRTGARIAENVLRQGARRVQ